MYRRFKWHRHDKMSSTIWNYGTDWLLSFSTHIRPSRHVRPFVHSSLLLGHNVCSSPPALRQQIGKTPLTTRPVFYSSLHPSLSHSALHIALKISYWNNSCVDKTPVLIISYLLSLEVLRLEHSPQGEKQKRIQPPGYNQDHAFHEEVLTERPIWRTEAPGPWPWLSFQWTASTTPCRVCEWVILEVDPLTPNECTRRQYHVTQK